MALTLNEIQAVTEDSWYPRAEDNFYKGNVLIYRLLRNGGTKDGGEKIRQPIWHGEPIGGPFSASTKFDTTKREQINAARFDWSKYYEPVTYDIDDDVQNSGTAAHVEIITTKLDMAQTAIRDKMGDDIYGDGTGTPTPITGLRAMINSTTSTAYGGITESDLSEWAPGAVTTTTEALTLPVMRTLKTACKVGDMSEDRPSIYLTTDSLRDTYEGLLQPQQRFTDSSLAAAGFDNLAFDSRPVVGDTKCPSGFMFALNEKYMDFVSHMKYKFIVKPWMRPTNQELYTTQILWVGNLTCSRRGAHGYHSNLS